MTPWTETQLRAIGLFEADVCVPAGAGSGKTAVLVERYLHAVDQKGFKPSEILAITFTDKAAAEMKRRLIEESQKRGLSTLRGELEAAPIGTIHAFCARLLRENPVECAMDPEFRVLGEGERELTLARVFDTLFESEAANPRAIEMLALYGEKGVRQAFGRLSEKLRSSGLGRKRAEDPDFEALEKEARRNLALVVDRLLSTRKEKGEWTETEAQSRGVSERLRGVMASLPGWDKMESARSLLKKMHAGSKTLKDVVRQAQSAFGDWESAEAARLSLAVRAEFLRLFERYERLLDEEKKRLVAYDFDDLIDKALEALRGTDPARRAFAERTRARFRAVFVDEYQDVNPAQAALVECLRSRGGRFVVGDSRQSIYGFRHADPEIFERVRASSDIVSLSDNFRSRATLLDFVNSFFEERFSGEDPLAARKKYAEKATPSVEILAVPLDDEEDEKLDRARVREARILAARLQAIVRSRLVIEPKGEKPRPMEWRDVAVLFRKTTAVRFYDQAFREAGIPFDLPKGKGFFEKNEITDLTCFLSILDDPHEDIPLAAVLRSPLVGLSDDALYGLARARPEKAPFFEALSAPAGIPEADRARLEKFKTLFEHLHEARERLGVSRILETILAETGYRLTLAAGAGPQALANVDKLIDLARECESAGGGVADFVRLTQVLADRDDDEPEAKMPVDRGDAVSFLTVHAAKGLEFPLVVIADMGAESPPRGHFFLSSITGEVGLKFKPPAGETWIADPIYRRLRSGAAARAAAESDRLLYVAMTRAREHLILSGAWKKPPKSRSPEGEEKERSWMQNVLEICGLPEPPPSGLAQWGKIPMLWISPEAPRQIQAKPFRPVDDPDICGLAQKDPSPPEGEGLALRMRLAMPEKSYEMIEDVTVTRLVEAASKEEIAVLLAEEPDKEALAREEGDEEPRIPANRFGTVFHKVMELSMRPVMPGPPSFGELDAWTREFSDAERGRLSEQVLRFWKGDLGERVRTAGRRHPELPFIYKTAHGLLKGQIDLAFESGKDGWTILDYKTNRISESQLEETAKRYEFQLALYAFVFAELYGETPKRGILYFSAPDRWVEFAYTPAAIRAVGERLDKAHAALAAGIAFPASI